MVLSPRASRWLPHMHARAPPAGTRRKAQWGSLYTQPSVLSAMTAAMGALPGAQKGGAQGRPRSPGLRSQKPRQGVGSGAEGSSARAQGSSGAAAGAAAGRPPLLLLALHSPGPLNSMCSVTPSSRPSIFSSFQSTPGPPSPAPPSNSRWAKSL